MAAIWQTPLQRHFRQKIFLIFIKISDLFLGVQIDYDPSLHWYQMKPQTIAWSNDYSIYLRIIKGSLSLNEFTGYINKL